MVVIFLFLFRSKDINYFEWKGNYIRVVMFLSKIEMGEIYIMKVRGWICYLGVF